MAEDWMTISRSLGFHGEKDMWKNLYIDRGLSVSKLAAALQVGTATVTRRMEMCGIERRERGGANGTSHHTRKLYYLDPRFVFLAPDDEVARLIGAHWSTVYKFKRKLMNGRIHPL